MRCLIATLTLASTWAIAAKVEGHARTWMGAGFDSNAKRDYVSAGRAPDADGFLFGLSQFDGRVWGTAGDASAAYDLATRKFIRWGQEDMLVQNLQLQGSLRLGPVFDAGLTARGRDRRGASRDYTSLGGEGFIVFTPDERLQLMARGGVDRFLFWASPDYGFVGPTGAVNARYRINRRHSINASGWFSPRAYDGARHDDPATTDFDESLERRTDISLSASAGYTYRGPFVLNVSYTYAEQASNSHGESFRRHRLWALAGFRLPAKLSLFASGVLQLSYFPDNVFLSPEIQVVEDDENSSYVTLKLVWPFADKLELDLRYALYINALPGSEQTLFYMRHVVSVGLAVSL